MTEFTFCFLTSEVLCLSPFKTQPQMSSSLLSEPTQGDPHPCCRQDPGCSSWVRSHFCHSVFLHLCQQLCWRCLRLSLFDDISVTVSMGTYAKIFICSKYNPHNHIGRISRTDDSFMKYLSLYSHGLILASVTKSVLSPQCGFSYRPAHISHLSYLCFSSSTPSCYCTLAATWQKPQQHSQSCLLLAWWRQAAVMLAPYGFSLYSASSRRTVSQDKSPTDCTTGKSCFGDISLFEGIDMNFKFKKI